MFIENINPESAQTSPRTQFFIGLGLAAIILLGAFLRFYNLGATSVGNAYYAATVKSMLVSWSNFFFVAFEPGGSVSVDKPPLGFWLEAVSAYFLGVNGFALALPNALAGVLSIPLLYALLKKQFGILAGLAAALALAVMPVTIAAERNNTIDGMLVFVLLLAAWAVWKSVESARLRYLLLGVLLVGLGFNIKMLQAFMVLPALYALYFFGARHGWKKRIAHLGLASALLLVVSLSWALIVDAVPASSRPFIGSSTDNTVTELIVGHNGLKRLLGGPGLGGPGSARGGPGSARGGPGSARGGPGRPGSDQSAAGLQPGFAPPAPGGNVLRPGGQNEVGDSGPLRLFTEPLASQASWLLPLALLGLALAVAVLGRPSPLTSRHLALILWAGWLLPVAFYFSFTGGLWHTYYLIMLGPALAALVGAAVWALAQLLARRHRFAWHIAALLSGLTLGFEIFILSAYPAYFALTSILMVVFWLAGLLLLWVRPQTWTLAVLMLALLGGPLLWSGLTTFNTQPEVNLPKAGSQSGQPGNDPTGTHLSPDQDKVLNYLLAHTESDAILVATYDSHGASPFILASGRAVLTLGGFRGDDEVLTLAQLQELIASGELRYMLDTGTLNGKPEIFAWVSSSCRLAKVPGLPQSVQTMGQPAADGLREGQSLTLYDCQIQE